MGINWKWHYEPYPDPEEPGHPFCGQKNYVNMCPLTTTNWDKVTCKKCLKLKKQAKDFVNQTEKHILADMKGFVDFMNEKNEDSQS